MYYCTGSLHEFPNTRKMCKCYLGRYRTSIKEFCKIKKIFYNFHDYAITDRSELVARKARETTEARRTDHNTLMTNKRVER